MKHQLRSRKWGAALAALGIMLLAGLARGQIQSGVYGAYTNNYGVFGYQTSDGVTAVIDAYIGPGGAVAIPGTLTDVVTSDFDDNPEYGNLTVTSIGGGGAFSGCTNLTSVNLPNTVNTIGNNTFNDCTSLTNVNIPDSVTDIGDAAFSGCTSLSSVNLPNSVHIIGTAAFVDCTNLTRIDLGNAVIGIGYSAFYDCTSLTSVTIPASLASIGDYAFEMCYSLSSAYFLGNVLPDDGTVFLLDPTTVYYLHNAVGWGSTYGSVPAVLWNPQANTFSHIIDQFGFDLTGPTNLTIVVEACTNLSSPAWLPVATNTFSGLGTSTFSDSQSGAYPVRFYRIRSP